MRSHVSSALTSFALAASCLAATAAPTANPKLPGPVFPSFADAKAVELACQKGLDGANARVRKLEQHPPNARWLAALDDFNAYIEDTAYPVEFVLNVHPDKAVRDAAQACALRWQDFSSTFGQNDKLYQAARQVKPRDAIDREALRVTMESFEDSGVALPADKRARAKQLSDRISELGKQYDKAVRDDDTKVAFTVDELAGVPEAVWKDKPRDDAGRVVLGLDSPTYLPVLERATSGATRERMYRAKLNEGGEGNLKLLAELVQLRREYAGLFGYKTFADFQLRRRMAGNVPAVTKFLDEVKAAVTEREIRDLELLRQAKAQQLKQPLESTKIERWDVSYYTERVRRERYSVDQEAFRQHFPPEESLQFVMRVVERMFGVRYTRVPAKLWHPDAQAYAMSDAKTGKAMATLYVDMYPRDGKYNHAAVWPLRSSATRTGRTPQGAFVVNMDRKGLTLGELHTLLHEMGHAVHNNLSATRYVALGGTNVQWDFVEAPSQMLEDWVYDKRVLKTFAEVCPKCKPVPDEMIDKAVVAKDFAKGIAVARQHLYASYDISMYSATDAVDPMALWSKMESTTPLGHVQGTKLPASFSHIASGGYTAGYYGYLWSLVVAMDMRSPFAKDRLDPVIGQRYRETLLSQGSQRPPKELVRNFLGRDPSSKAFFDDLKK